MSHDRKTNAVKPHHILYLQKVMSPQALAAYLQSVPQEPQEEPRDAEHSQEERLRHATRDMTHP